MGEGTLKTVMNSNGPKIKEKDKSPTGVPERHKDIEEFC